MRLMCEAVTWPYELIPHHSAPRTWRLIKQISRAVFEKLLVRESSGSWAGNYADIVGSDNQGARKKRKVEETENGRKTDEGRTLKWGTWKYKKKSGFRFQAEPANMGAYSLSKKVCRMMVWDRSGSLSKVEWTTKETKPEDDMPGIMHRKKLIIGRLGLGKKIVEVFKSKNACWRFDHRQQNKDREDRRGSLARYRRCKSDADNQQRFTLCDVSIARWSIRFARRNGQGGAKHGPRNKQVNC